MKKSETHRQARRKTLMLRPVLFIILLSFLLSITAATGSAATTDVIASGASSGTHLVTLDQALDGTLTVPSSDVIISPQSTWGSYLSPNGNLYVNTYRPGPGGQYGLLKFNEVSGTWSQTAFYPWSLPGSMCALDLKNAAENPETGVLEAGASLFELNFDMASGSWAQPVLRFIGGTHDIAYSSLHSDKIWASGGGTAIPPANPLPICQNRTFMLDGIEYIANVDLPAGDLLLIDTATNNPVSRTPLGLDEPHSIGLNVDAVTNSGTSSPGIQGIISNGDGSMEGVLIYHDSFGAIAVDVKNTVKIMTASSAGGDICGLDIVGVDSVWKRN